MMLDLAHAQTVAEEAAKKAGDIIERALNEDIDFQTKTDPADRVTQTDIDAEKAIVEVITREFPDHAIIGEEDANKEGNSEYKWVIDPLDGTMNFTHKLPFCGVSIGLEQNGEGIVGILYFPALHWMYSAAQGKGATKNGNPIGVSTCTEFKDAMVAEIFSDRETRGKMAAYPPSAAFRKFGSAVTSLALLAEGSIDGTVLRCRHWDIAAGEVIVKEAGGEVIVQKDNPEDPRTSLTCIAGTPGIIQDLQNFIGKEV